MFNYIINIFFFVFLILGLITFLCDWVRTNFVDSEFHWDFLFRGAKSNYWMQMFLAVAVAKALSKLDTIIMLLK